METPSNLFRNGMYQTGLAAILLSLIIFCLPFSQIAGIQQNGGLFIMHFLIAVIYFFTLWFGGYLRKKNGGIYFFFLFLVLFLISAYSLNRDFNVFEDSTGWLCVLLVISCVNYIAFGAFQQMPSGVQQLMCFVLGISFVVFLYLAMYLVSLYPLSAALFFVLGLPLHSFVPLLFVIFTIRLMRKIRLENKLFLYRFYGAIAVCACITVLFTIQWAIANNRLAKAYNSIDSQTTGLPAWVRAAQVMDNSNLATKVLKAGIVYSVPDKWNSNSFWGSIPSSSLDEKAKHDPLIMTAALFSPVPEIPDEERVKMLKVLADARHKTQERLWNGDDLVTRSINTVAQVWPSLHIAYTEKTITVRNNADKNGWRNNQQEAIYTFQLPEGSVVTALSLWIDNKEEKAILTTKEKATTAYKTIVGVEQRDPSVLHWQEGNTVSVRVFPVLGNEERKFKIGVTSPLPVVQGNLIYNNIVFQGPATASTTEDVEVIFEESPADFITATALQESSSRKYLYSGKYNPSWGLAWKDKGVKPGVFSFDNNTYLLKPYIKRRVFTDIDTVYLDVNHSWTSKELQEVYASVKSKQVYVYNNGFKKLSDGNLQSIAGDLQKLHFSIFPFYAINNHKSLVITKSGEQSASLDDLNQSAFYTGLKGVKSDTKIKLFNIGYDLSVYLKSLREMRMFDYEQGTVGELKELVDKQYFAADVETDNMVVLYDANLTILKDSGTIASNAPDHLMRLFAYNNIMRKGATTFLNNDILESDSLVAMAKQAHIVTPLSSLIVLETRKDYERFNIENSKNSLQNASIKSKGAVPEPHEWALIIMVVLLAFYLKWKHRLRAAFSGRSH